MYTFQVWFRIGGYRTAEARINASDWHQAQMIAESQYGSGNIISITMAS